MQGSRKSNVPEPARAGTDAEARVIAPTAAAIMTFRMIFSFSFVGSGGVEGRRDPQRVAQSAERLTKDAVGAAEETVFAHVFPADAERTTNKLRSLTAFA